MAYSGVLHRLAKLSSQGADSVLASEGYVTLVYANDEHPADHRATRRTAHVSSVYSQIMARETLQEDERLYFLRLDGRWDQ